MKFTYMYFQKKESFMCTIISNVTGLKLILKGVLKILTTVHANINRTRQRRYL